MKCPPLPVLREGARCLLEWDGHLSHFHISMELGIYVFIHSQFFMSFLSSFPTRFLFTHLEVTNCLFFFMFIFSQYLGDIFNNSTVAAAMAEKFRMMKGPEKQVRIVFLQNRHFLAQCFLPRARIALFRLVVDRVLPKQWRLHTYALPQEVFFFFRSGIPWSMVVLVYLELCDQAQMKKKSVPR